MPAMMMWMRYFNHRCSYGPDHIEIYLQHRVFGYKHLHQAPILRPRHRSYQPTEEHLLIGPDRSRRNSPQIAVCLRVDLVQPIVPTAWVDEVG
jgi:hypothetical protein